MNISKSKLLFFFFISVIGNVFSQSPDVAKPKPSYKGMVFQIDDEHKMKLSFTNQVWVRYTATNPGTTVFGDPQDHVFDIGLRRTRLVLEGNPFDKVYVFMQMGMNNFSFISKREQGFYFHDALADYEFHKYCSLGAGLTAWGGFSRFSSPSIGSALGVDVPLFAQATNGATDQFLRKLSVFAKGDVERFSYSIAASKPMAIQQSSMYGAISTNSSFSDKAPNMQYHGYLQYAFADKESHNNPYFKGTYHGQKNILNFGVGMLYQKDAMHRLTEFGDTTFSNLAILSADVFWDKPVGENAAISVYGAYYNYNFGKGYLRNIGAMNPANGNSDPSIVNSGGSAYPSIGTGDIWYLQAGYLIPIKISESKMFKIMPYASTMLANYDALTNKVMSHDIGLNVLLKGHQAKITIAYQNRPVFKTNALNQNELYTRRGLGILQFQTSI